MKKHLTLQQKLMLGCSALLVGVLLLVGVTIIPQRQSRAVRPTSPPALAQAKPKVRWIIPPAADRRWNTGAGRKRKHTAQHLNRTKTQNAFLAGLIYTTWQILHPCT